MLTACRPRAGYLLNFNLTQAPLLTGSLTTPPCTEAVNWYVFADTAPVNAIDVLDHQHLLEGVGVLYGQNARPLKPLNKRKLDYCQF